MGIQPASAYLVSSRPWNVASSETGQQGANDHDRTPEGTAILFELQGLQVVEIHIIRLKCIGVPVQSFDLDAQLPKNVDELVDIPNVRNIADRHFRCREQGGTDHLKRLVLCTLGNDLAL